MYVCSHVSMKPDMLEGMHVCLHTYIYTYGNTHTLVCIHVCMHKCIHVCISASIHKLCTCRHVQMHPDEYTCGYISLDVCM